MSAQMFLYRVIMFMHQSGANFQPQHPKSLFSLWSSKLLSALPLSVAVCDLKIQAHAYTQLFIVPDRPGTGQVNSKSEVCFSQPCIYFFSTSIKKCDHVMENIFHSPSLLHCNSVLIISLHAVYLCDSNQQHQM